jgi:hypothetical protein
LSQHVVVSGPAACSCCPPASCRCQQGESLLEEMAGLPPQERIASVRPFWESLSQGDREALLTVPLDELRAYAERVVRRLRLQAGARPHPALLCASYTWFSLHAPLAALHGAGSCCPAVVLGWARPGGGRGCGCSVWLRRGMREQTLLWDQRWQVGFSRESK